MAFPTYSDSVDIAQLQAAVLELVRSRIKSGTVTVNVTNLVAGQGAGPVAVNFTTPFANTPSVRAVLQSAPGGSAYLVARTTGVSASGFNVYVYNVGSSSATASVTVAWEASDLGNA